MSDQRHALRQNDVFHVQRVTGFNLRQIEFDEGMGIVQETPAEGGASPPPAGPA